MENISDLAISFGSGVGVVVATIALVLGSYFAARHLLHPGNERDRTLEVAGNVAVRVQAS